MLYQKGEWADHYFFIDKGDIEDLRELSGEPLEAIITNLESSGSIRRAQICLGTDQSEFYRLKIINNSQGNIRTLQVMLNYDALNDLESIGSGHYSSSEGCEIFFHFEREDA